MFCNICTVHLFGPPSTGDESTGSCVHAFVHQIYSVLSGRRRLPDLEYTTPLMISGAAGTRLQVPVLVVFDTGGMEIC